MARNIEFDESAVIAKAQLVFWKKGYHATSMQDLVKATGLNPGSIYNTFGSKHDLFLLCLKDYIRPVLDFDPGKPVKNSWKALELYIRMIAENGTKSDDACLTAKTCFEMGAADAEIHDALKCSALKSLANLEQLIKHAQGDGTVRTDVKAEDLSQTVSAMLAGLSANFIMFKDKQRIEKVVKNLLALIRS